jgi:hypothetical protein
MPVNQLPDGAPTTWFVGASGDGEDFTARFLAGGIWENDIRIGTSMSYGRCDRATAFRSSRLARASTACHSTQA